MPFTGEQNLLNSINYFINETSAFERGFWASKTESGVHIDRLGSRLLTNLPANGRW